VLNQPGFLLYYQNPDYMTAPSLKSVSKSKLINNRGVKYKEFRATLKPKYFIVWLHIAIGYALMAMTLFAVCYIQKAHGRFFWLSIPLGAINVGYWFSFAHLFIHEAAHYNIAGNKRLNDLLADIFLGLIAGMHIKFYRVIHFDHHRYLGTPKDTENTYFEPLNGRFILESLTGIRVLRVISARNKIVKQHFSDKPDILKQNKKMFLAGALFNLSLVLIFCFTGF
jgi:fatty acid desaturase